MPWLCGRDLFGDICWHVSATHFLIENVIFHTIYSGHGFPTSNSSQILPAAQLHAFFISLENSQTNPKKNNKEEVHESYTEKRPIWT